MKNEKHRREMKTAQHTPTLTAGVVPSSRFSLRTWHMLVALGKRNPQSFTGLKMGGPSRWLALLTQCVTDYRRSYPMGLEVAEGEIHKASVCSAGCAVGA
jgi:hypothetical protein